MKKPQWRFVFGFGTLLCLLVATPFSNRCDWGNWLGHLMLSLSKTHCLPHVVAGAEPSSNCPQDDAIESGVDLESLGAKYLRQGKVSTSCPRSALRNGLLV